MNEEDLKFCRGINYLVSEGDFKLQGKAVERSAVLFRWLRELEPKLVEAIANEKELEKYKIEIISSDPIKPMEGIK